MKDCSFFRQTILSSVWMSLLLHLSEGYERKPCTHSVAAQFSFPDCYVPDMNPSLLLSEASFLMSHDAATGYLKASKGISGATNMYAKNQIGGVYDQLNDGARALDVRPKLLANGTVICHHGTINIPVTLETLVRDAIRWSNDNPDELVLIDHLNFVYENATASADTTVVALSAVYDALGVIYVECGDLYGFTVEDAMEMSELSSGGYLLAMDRHDASASSCAKGNYVSDQIVTCYPNNNTVPCTKPNSSVLDDLKAYVIASANNDPTDSRYVLGPPASLDYFPFNKAQALWQVDTHSAALGVAHLSSVLDDNTKSRVNAHLVDWVYHSEFDAISLLMVDRVQLNGNALLSVLRNTCGQSEMSEDACGAAVNKPKLRQKPMSTLTFFATVIVYAAFGIWLAIMLRHYRKYYNHDQQVQRIKQDLAVAQSQVNQAIFAGEPA
jgi:hypothetical protein